ncbi:MAG: A/G-specific adenine glycosylase [Akkermansiaceae bacterium]|jgi:A/G-specific adenine glycosylase
MNKEPPSNDPGKEIRAFRALLLQWFEKESKDWPWRRTRDPWSILVSEIMLQQTTVASVIANRRYERFLEEFPDIATMSAASENQILKAWEGLGYYNRVRNLQKAARHVLDHFSGEFPPDASTLETLPGVGRYTAGAVSSFAFDQPAPIVDANIARVISRLFNISLAIDSTPGQKIIWERAGQLLDQKSPRLFNSAIMELGQTFCSPRTPSCPECPVKKFCQCPDPGKLPVKKPRRQFVAVDEHAFLHLKGGQVLLAMGEASRRRGFWHLPMRDTEDCAHLESSSQHRYTITHHRVTVHLYHHNPGKILEGEVFHKISDLESLPIASPMRRILESEL